MLQDLGVTLHVHLVRLERAIGCSSAARGGCRPPPAVPSRGARDVPDRRSQRKWGGRGERGRRAEFPKARSSAARGETTDTCAPIDRDLAKLRSAA